MTLISKRALRRNGNGSLKLTPSHSPKEELLITTEAQALQAGQDQAAQLGARLPALRPALEGFIRRLRQPVTPSRHQQLQRQIDDIEGQKNVLTNRAEEVRETLIPDREEQIEAVKSENEEYRFARHSIITSFDKLDYRILGAILIAVTVYVIAFYASACYSAYLWNPERELRTHLQTGTVDISGIFSSVFKANLFGLVRQQGWIGLFFILLNSGVFLAFGYLLHKLLEIPNTARRYSTVAGIGAVVFAYDALLAYLIAEKIYRLSYLAGLAESPWTTAMVLFDGRFYAVLFGGFVVCVGWGILLYFFMEERKKTQPIRVNQARIARLKAEISTLKTEADSIHAQVTSCEARMRRKRREIDGLVLGWDYVQGRVHTFALGWMKQIEMTQKNVDGRMKAVAKVVDQFLQEQEPTFNIPDDQT